MHKKLQGYLSNFLDFLGTEIGGRENPSAGTLEIPQP